MAPKKKGGKGKKKDDSSEPPHEPSWERVRGSCVLRCISGVQPCTKLSMQVATCMMQRSDLLLVLPLSQTVEGGVWEKPVTDLPGRKTGGHIMR